IMGRRGLPLSLETIGNYAADIVGAPLGETWPRRFKDRHNNTLRVRWTHALEICRAKALNPTAVHEYFTLLTETINKYDINWKNIYNMDEKGIQL
ncbi:hypothetical protein DFH07DRAFT_692194, partial [Mycena maculata]